MPDAGPPAEAEGPTSESASVPPAPAPRRILSPLTRWIVVINLIGLMVLFGGALLLSNYRQGLIEARLTALATEGELVAGALIEAALIAPETAARTPRFDLDVAVPIVRRMAMASGTRIRLYDQRGTLVIDSRNLVESGRVQTYRLAPPDGLFGQWPAVGRLYDWVVGRLPSLDLPRYYEGGEANGRNYGEVARALAGESGEAVRINAANRVVVSVAAPVQRLKVVQGAVLLTRESGEIEAILRAERIQILQFFVIAFLVSVLLSLALASTIGRPIRKLALAAESVRTGRAGRVEIPRFVHRQDEIGDLARSLAHMTDTLYSRVDATERFAADVAHEIKNPLTSLRSAVETIQGTDDPTRQSRLLAIIKDDVGRIDRLITDIAEASRLDGELSRAPTQAVNLASLLRVIAEMAGEQERGGQVPVDVEADSGALGGEAFIVRGHEGRLAQVFRNVIDNALSFSPPDGRVKVRIRLGGIGVIVTVEDEGPGIPAESLEKIFDRFYTARETKQEFGKHSGLGLAIARQIVEAHGGTITAQNRRDGGGGVIGARFQIALPR